MMSFLREILYALEVRVCLKKVLGILKYRLKVYFNFQNKYSRVRIKYCLLLFFIFQKFLCAWKPGITGLSCSRFFSPFSINFANRFRDCHVLSADNHNFCNHCNIGGYGHLKALQGGLPGCPDL